MKNSKLPLKFLHLALLALLAPAAPAHADEAQLCNLLIQTSVIEYLNEPHAGITLKEFVWSEIPENSCERPAVPDDLTDEQLYGDVVGYFDSEPDSVTLEEDTHDPRAVLPHAEASPIDQLAPPATANPAS